MKLTKVVYLTPEGQAKLEEELAYLRLVRRREVAERLREAMDEGDDPEESVAYDIAREEQAFLEGRIREVESLLARAQVLEAITGSDTVSIGSVVTIRGEGESGPERYHIVSPVEADPRQGRISYESPLGKALLERQVGERVEVQAPDGLLRYTLMEVN
jgi:transcription elongation factor GreA